MVESGKILITGAAGFVGTALCRRLLQLGYSLRVLLRPNGSRLPEDLACELDDIVEVLDDLTEEDTWMNLLAGVTTVVHLAARAHCRDQSPAADLYFSDNLDMTVVLARAARRSGVKKFIFLSTIKVNGEGVFKADHHPYKASDQPHPAGAYAISKWRAEQELQALFEQTDYSVLTILRPPLIYGLQAKGNYAFLQKWLRWGLPVPVSRAGNHRSLLALESLVGIISALISEVGPAPDRLLLPCDRQEWSTERLVHHLAQKVGRSAWILPLPEVLLRGLAAISPNEDFFVKFFGSLRIEPDDKAFELYHRN